SLENTLDIFRINTRPSIAHRYEEAISLGLLRADRQLSWPLLNRPRGSDVRVVHGGVEHARSEGREGAAGGVGVRGCGKSYCVFFGPTSVALVAGPRPVVDESPEAAASHHHFNGKCNQRRDCK